MNDQHTKPTPRTSETARTDAFSKTVAAQGTAAPAWITFARQLELELSDATRRERERCAVLLEGRRTHHPHRDNHLQDATLTVAAQAIRDLKEAGNE